MAKSLSEAKAHNNLRKSVQSVAKKLSEAKAPLKSVEIREICGKKAERSEAPLSSVKIRVICGKKTERSEALLKSAKIRGICGQKNLSEAKAPLHSVEISGKTQKAIRREPDGFLYTLPQEFILCLLNPQSP